MKYEWKNNSFFLAWTLVIVAMQLTIVIIIGKATVTEEL